MLKRDFKLKIWLMLSVISFLCCAVLCSVLVIKAAEKDKAKNKSNTEAVEKNKKKSESEKAETKPSPSTEKGKQHKNVKDKEETVKPADEETDDNEENKAAEESIEDKSKAIDELAEKWFDSLSLEQKVAGLFVTGPNDITGVTALVAGAKTKAALKDFPAGGFILNDTNIQTPDQLTKMTAGIKQIAEELNIPPLILCIDEEGGKVLRIGDNLKFPDEATKDMFSLVKEAKQTNKENLLYEKGLYIGEYLKKYGFTMDLAPVVDVWTNPQNVVIGNRAFANNAKDVSKYAIDFADGLNDKGITSVFKHFPGHGDTSADTHTGKAVSNKTKADLNKLELIPYKTAIENGAEVIMVSHVTFPKIDSKPASLSSKIVTDLLKKEMGYKNLVMTDSLGMQAAVGGVGVNRVAVEALKAGNDILLVGANAKQMQASILAAVKSKEISEERINESIRKILRYKAKYELR